MSVDNCFRWRYGFHDAEASIDEAMSMARIEDRAFTPFGTTMSAAEFAFKRARIEQRSTTTMHIAGRDVTLFRRLIGGDGTSALGWVAVVDGVEHGAEVVPTLAASLPESEHIPPRAVAQFPTRGELVRYLAVKLVSRK